MVRVGGALPARSFRTQRATAVLRGRRALRRADGHGLVGAPRRPTAHRVHGRDARPRSQLSGRARRQLSTQVATRARSRARKSDRTGRVTLAAGGPTLATVKAAVYYETGPPSVLKYEDVDDPPCIAGCVRIEVEAISIEGGDTLNRAGGILVTRPHIVGYQ